MKGLHQYVCQLEPKGMENIIVLLEAREIQEYYKEMDLISFYQLYVFHTTYYPIVDYSVPSNKNMFIQLLKSIDQHLDQGNVIIHCSAGKGRSGTAAASYLVYKGLPKSKAISLVRQVNPNSIESSL